MAALNFVASEDGLEESPKLLGLARALRVPRRDAFWFVIRLRRLVLQHGNHITGILPKQFTDDDIAGFLEFEGKAKLLTNQLKVQGFIGRRKGRQFYYPDWVNTVTGQYAARRESDRLWHEQQRRTRQSADVARPSADASSDGLSTSDDNQTGRKEGRTAGLPPVPPPAGGATLGAERWGWLLENAPTPQNREVCVGYLQGLSPDDWTLVQYAYTTRKQADRNISRKNARTLEWATDIWLRKQAYLRFRGYWLASQNASTKAKAEPGTKPTKKSAEEEKAELKAKSLTYLLALLADPNASESKKDKAKADWSTTWGDQPWTATSKRKKAA
jgi:hypothetical protein